MLSPTSAKHFIEKIHPNILKNTFLRAQNPSNKPDNILDTILILETFFWPELKKLKGITHSENSDPSVSAYRFAEVTTYKNDGW
ncbi:hypothetical protein [Chryseobacterium sp. ERMR1:04]|uniref:hypothetical protein n=1 Tax=Chryseobacterium sp. ERMR1:04 TaxID=1705393 RepID=UPI0006C8D980|nr:hypothetical protein [Chryseobacterium sp. ERMR1:04]KPH13384.1 hypothetical protein AMQ68_13155 [Chryseobacterium sp. ERMR1:04]